MPDAPADMPLAGGLGTARAQALADLVAAVTGPDAPLRALPYLAPALLFADPGVQARLDMPVAGESEILVHEYQSIHYPRALPLNTDLLARAETTRSDDAAEFRFALTTLSGAPVASLVTALRLYPKTDLGAVKATAFRLGALDSSVCQSPQTTVTQAQTNAYLALSGDANPIHHDPAQARLLGLAAPIVPGLLLVSLIQPLCEATLPGAALRSLKSRFLAPLCTGAPLRIALQQRGAASDGLTRARAYLIAEDNRALAITDLQFQPQLTSGPRP